MSRLYIHQLGGERRDLVLEDHAAPHGRPWNAPYAVDHLGIRQTESYVAGFDVPIRHVAGRRYEPVEFNGRLSDRYGGLGFAHQKSMEIKNFVADAQLVAVQWEGQRDVHVALVGMLTDYYPSRESEHEIAYRLVLSVDSDQFTPSRKVRATPPALRDNIAKIQFEHAQIKLAMPKMPLRWGIFDLIDRLISKVAEAIANVLAVANLIQETRRKTTAAIRRLRAVLGQLRTAVVMMRNAVDEFSGNMPAAMAREFERLNQSAASAAGSPGAAALVTDALATQAATSAAGQSSNSASVVLGALAAQSDEEEGAEKARQASAAAIRGALETQNAEAQLAFEASQAAISNSALIILEEIAKADRQASLEERGSIRDIIIATGGDTFESLSVRAYGTAERAGDIREANGATTLDPVPGELYVIPI